jgi:CheY-like chemotaxis protein
MKRPINILLIEDDYLDQVEVQRMMDKRSILYKIRIAKNGEEGLQMLRDRVNPVFSGLPDIILLDLNMPKMNGFEFLQNLTTEELNDTKVFVLTTSDQKEDMAMARNFRISGFITKPLKLESPSSLDAFNLMIDLMNMQS